MIGSNAIKTQHICCSRPKMFTYPSLHEKCSYSEFFWSVFCRIWTEYWREKLWIWTFFAQCFPYTSWGNRQRVLRNLRNIREYIWFLRSCCTFLRRASWGNCMGNCREFLHSILKNKNWDKVSVYLSYFFMQVNALFVTSFVHLRLFSHPIETNQSIFTAVNQLTDFHVMWIVYCFN